MKASNLKRINPDQPLLVRLPFEINNQVPSNLASQTEQFIICASSESEDGLSSANVSKAYEAIVRLTVERRFRRIIVPLIGTGANLLPVSEVATGMLQAINNELKSLRPDSLEEITIVDRNEDRIVEIVKISHSYKSSILREQEEAHKIQGSAFLPLCVFLEGDKTGIELVRQALRQSGWEGQPSLNVRETDQLETANFRVIAQDHAYGIVRPADDRPLVGVGQVTGYAPESALGVVQRLEHIARWQAIATLASPADSRIPANAVQMQIEVNGVEQNATDLRLEYQYANGKWAQPTFRLKLQNTWTEPLYCSLLDLTERFSVSAELLPGGGVWLQPGEEAWALDGNLFYCTVPKELWQQGVTEYQDVLKLMVSTVEFDSTLLQQDNLDVPVTRSPRSLRRGVSQQRGTLNRLMNQVMTRDIGLKPEEDEIYDEWVTSQVQITTVWPQEAITLQSEDR
jgi:hypothetical protein